MPKHAKKTLPKNRHQTHRMAVRAFFKFQFHFFQRKKNNQILKSIVPFESKPLRTRGHDSDTVGCSLISYAQFFVPTTINEKWYTFCYTSQLRLKKRQQWEYYFPSSVSSSLRAHFHRLYSHSIARTRHEFRSFCIPLIFASVVCTFSNWFRLVDMLWSDLITSKL